MSIYKIRDWINLDKLNWHWLSSNPVAIHLLQQNPDKIVWNMLSRNPEAIHLLEQNQDKIDWSVVSENPGAIQLIEKTPIKSIGLNYHVIPEQYGY